MNQCELAEQIATEAHKNQTRWDGTPYIEHPKRVALSFNDDLMSSVAWLHDVLEDTELTAQDLINKGIQKDVVSMVEILTKRIGEDYYSFIVRVRENPVASKIKIADIGHNLLDLKEGSMKDKYRLARHTLIKSLEDKK